MIFFYCPECKEELEADDDIKGTKMKCPACLKEIDVPLVGVRVDKRRATTSIRGRPRERESEEIAAGLSGRFVLVVLLVSFALLGTLFGVGMYLRSQQQADNRPACSACAGKGTDDCSKCEEGKVLCVECGGDGKRENFRDEIEDCPFCGASGRVACRICGGKGVYACSRCGGTGKGNEAPGN